MLSLATPLTFGFDVIFELYCADNEKQVLIWCMGVKGSPGAEVTIFHDLSLRFAPDNSNSLFHR